VKDCWGDSSIVGVKLSELRLRRPRQWGAVLGCHGCCGGSALDQFWASGARREPSKGPLGHVLFVLVAYRLPGAGREWRLHREWFQASARPICWARMPGSRIHKRVSLS